MKSLKSISGTQDYVGDQCVFGSPYQKPTRWRTTAPWLQFLAKRCPGVPSHPRHIILKGQAMQPDGSMAWMAAFGAEYPQTMCQQIARAYMSDRSVGQDCKPTLIDATGTHEPCAEPSKKQQRLAENDAAIGGMKSPHKSLTKVPGWYPVGKQLREALDKVADKYNHELRDVLDAMGTIEDITFPEEIQAAAASAVESVCGIQNGTGAQIKGVRHDLVDALSKMAADPDNVLPQWFQGYTPLGVKNPIPTRGIFPTTSKGVTAKTTTLEEAESWSLLTEGQGNYAPAEDCPQDVEKELLKDKKL